MKKFYLLAQSLFLLFVLIGCSANPELNMSPLPGIADEQNLAEVYVIRDRTFYPSTLPVVFKTPAKWYVTLDSVPHAALNIGQYTKLLVDAGETQIHTVGMKRWDSIWLEKERPLIVAPGEKYYMLVGRGGQIEMALRSIDEKEAAGWLETGEYVPAIK